MMVRPCTRTWHPVLSNSHYFCTDGLPFSQVDLVAKMEEARRAMPNAVVVSTLHLVGPTAQLGDCVGTSVQHPNHLMDPCCSHRAGSRVRLVRLLLGGRRAWAESQSKGLMDATETEVMGIEALKERAEE